MWYLSHRLAGYWSLEQRPIPVRSSSRLMGLPISRTTPWTRTSHCIQITPFGPGRGRESEERNLDLILGIPIPSVFHPLSLPPL